MSLRRSVALAALLAVCVVAAFAGVAAQRRHATPARDFAGTPVSPSKHAEDFVLTDGNGRPAHVLAKAPLEFLFFGYTHCPDECPLAMASLGRAYRSLDANARARTRVVFVTVDPMRDTPPVVGRYVSSFDPHFVGLTGTRRDLARVWRSYGVDVLPNGNDIGHEGVIYAIDERANNVLIYTPDAPATALAGDAAKLAE